MAPYKQRPVSTMVNTTGGDPVNAVVLLDPATGLPVTPSSSTSSVAAGDAVANPTAPQELAFMMVWDGTSAWRRLATFAQSSDAVSSGRFGIGAQAFGYRYNGTSFDRERGNVDGTAYASAARTATPTAMADAVNYNGLGVWVVIDVTAVTSTPSVTFTIQGKDPVSGKYVDLLTSAAIATISTVSLQLHPGLTAAANTVANGILPRTWRIIATHGNANSITYSVGYSLVM